MSRNGSGTYSVPNTFVPGDTITASGHNENWADLAAEMTNSVAADGQTAMTGPLKASLGSASAPSMTFAADTDTGFYRLSSNTIAFSAGGSQIVDVGPLGVGIVGVVNATTVKQGSSFLVPPGVIMPFAGASAPGGYLFCDGTEVSRTTYSDLYAAIGTTYGSGNGSTTFNLPDMRGRSVFGRDDMGGSVAGRVTTAGSGVDGTTLGAAGGAQNKTLARSDLPNVAAAVSITDPGHTHTDHIPTFAGGPSDSAFAPVAKGTGSSTTSSNTTGITASVNLNGGVTQTTVNGMPPAIIFNFIIKY